MDKVDRLGQLMGALRRRVLEAPKGAPGSGAASSDSAPPPSAAGRGSIDDLRDRIRERLRALPRDGAKRESRAARIFVESVLVWEFGDALLDDPRFADLAGRVDEQIASDAGLRRQLRELLEELAG